MKKFLVLLLLHLSFSADAQLTKTQLKSQIKSKLSKQVRPSDVRYFFDALADMAWRADSTAKAHAATAITSASSLQSGTIPTPRYGPEVVLTESIQSLKNKSIDLSFNQITGLTLAHVSGLSQALADKQAKITVGTTSQYLRGDLSLATFPAIPTAANFVSTTGVQTAIGGNKSWVGAHSFGSTLNVAGLSTLGKVKATDIVNLSLPTYETDAEAYAGTPPLTVNDLYRDSKGLVHAVNPISNVPEFNTYFTSGKEQPFNFADNIGEQTWKTQTPNQPYSFNFVSNRTIPAFRVELHPGDNWASDVTSKNSQNPKWDPTDPDGEEQFYQIKERSEGYTINASSAGGTYYYISYSFMVEPGYDVFYTNPDYFCYLGQWHNADSDKGPVPFAFNFSGQDKLQLQIREFTNTATQLKTIATLKPRGQWNSMVIRVKFNTSSTSTKNGEFAWWVNETLQDNLTGLDLGSLTKKDASGATVPQTNKGYWKSGAYRTAGTFFTEEQIAAGTKRQRVNLAVQYANIRVTTTNLTAAPNNKITSPDPIN